MLEFTGDYYQCLDCEHIWDYMDDACPACGSKSEEVINSYEVIEHIEKYDGTPFLEESHKNNLIKMLELHGEYRKNEL